MKYARQIESSYCMITNLTPSLKHDSIEYDIYLFVNFSHVREQFDFVEKNCSSKQMMVSRKGAKGRQEKLKFSDCTKN